MSFLSPVAAAILNTLQSVSKSDGKADAQQESDVFQNLLDNGGNSDVPMFSDNEQSLVDTLYDKDDEPQAVAAPVEVPTSVFVENKYPAANTERAPRQESADKAEAPEQAAPQARPEPKAADKSPKKEEAKEAPASASKADAPKDASKAESKDAPVKAASQKDEEEPETLTSLAEKIRAKIDQLNDILSLLASGLGVSFGTQITVVQVTQTTLTVSQGLQGNQPFVDLSDRLKQLLAAVTAPGQNLPSDVQKTLGETFGEFQSLINSLAAGNSATFSATSVSVTTLTTAQVPTDTAIMSQFSSLQVSLNNALQAIAPQAATAFADKATLADALKQLNKWMGDVKTLTQAPAQAVAASEAPAAIVTQASDIPVITAAPAVQKITHTEKNAVDSIVQNNPASVVAANTAAPVQQAANNNAPGSAVIVANAVEATTGNANSGFSNNSGGQGGERQQAATVTGFTGVNQAAAAANMNAPSFGKTLKAMSAGSAPVAEQVAFNIKTAIKSGDSKIEIQLDPVELGKLHIKMNVSGDGKATNIVITADNKETLALLQRDARGLENALADAGLKTDSGSLSFNLRGGEQQQQDDKRNAFGSYAPVIKEEDDMAALAVVSKNYVVSAENGLDIHI